MKNLEIASLRALISVKELGGVGRAAEHLNLTQSAVSMQIKRLEDTLTKPLFVREKRSLRPTPEGLLLIEYARKIIDLHDDVRARIARKEFTGELRFGAPEDIVEAHFHNLLPLISREFPALRIAFEEKNSHNLLEKFYAGSLDVVLTTEVNGNGIKLCDEPVVWVGAKGGRSWHKQPIPLAVDENCAFRPMIEDALKEHAIEWSNVPNIGSSFAKYAIIAADIGVGGLMAKQVANAPRFEFIDGLPPLPDTHIYLYSRKNSELDFLPEIENLIKDYFGERSLPKSEGTIEV